jgi:hypothetical protein
MHACAPYRLTLVLSASLAKPGSRKLANFSAVTGCYGSPAEGLPCLGHGAEDELGAGVSVVTVGACPARPDPPASREGLLRDAVARAPRASSARPEGGGEPSS